MKQNTRQKVECLTSKLNESVIRAFLTAADALEYSFVLKDETKSTNDDAKALGRNGAAAGTVVLAESQNGGKGRLGRSFVSPDGSGVYMTLLLRPSFGFDAAALTAMAAVAVCEAVEAVCGTACLIKWVNDVYANGKKICGILAEAVYMGEQLPQFAVLGIGINVFLPQDGYGDLKNKVTALFASVSACKIANVREKLIAAVLTRLSALSRRPDANRMLDAYRARSFVPGNAVTVHSGNDVYAATAVCIDDNYGLWVRLPNGEERVLHFGEISVRLEE